MLETFLTGARRLINPALPRGPVSFRRAMVMKPVPLVNPEQRFILVFSPKSACTTAVIWFFSTMGVAAEARAFDPWPHEYRMKVANKAQRKLRRSRAAIGDFAMLRVVRDPLERAVSGYRHLLTATILMPEVARFLRRPVDRDNGLSFREFVSFLESIDLDTCNPHYARQRHAVEDFYPQATVVNITETRLEEAINAFEVSIGRPPTDFPRLAWVQELIERRFARRRDLRVADADAYDHRFNSQAAAGAFPPYAALLTEDAVARLARLFADDIARYGSRWVSPRAVEASAGASV